MSRLLSAVLMLCNLRSISAACVTCPGSGKHCADVPYKWWPLPHCQENLGINMKLYTRENKYIGQTITRTYVPTVFKGYRMTMYIVHGWKDSETSGWMNEMKNAVLEKVDYNVILVGWKQGAMHNWYPQAATNTRTVGGELALVNRKTNSSDGPSKARQYCVGHGLGAHVCGQAARTGQFGRITGLDPAGWLFEKETGLNPSRADFVDVIHTNGVAVGNLAGAGTMDPLGDVDFYPNGGKVQPGCNFNIACHHMRAVYYFIESIRDRSCFHTKQSCTDEDNLPGSCYQSDYPVQSIGFDSNTYQSRGVFYLTTNSQSPYCQK